MTATIGIDGIGGDQIGQYAPHLRALLALASARKDAKYVLAVPDKVVDPQFMGRDITFVPFRLEPETHKRIEEKLVEHPNVTRPELEKRALQQAAVAYFVEKNIPFVTPFNSQVGVPAIATARIPGIKRLALAPELPRDKSDTPFLFLDLGANSDMYIARDIDAPPDVPLDDLVDSDPAQVKTFLQKQRDYNDKLLTRYLPSKQYERNAKDIARFAELGALYMELRYNRARPKVGLLNVGTEQEKGNAFIEKCNAAIAQSAQAGHFEYVGFAEINDVSDLDVLVTDGFTGNNVLKGIEKGVRHTKDKIPGLVKAICKMVGKTGSTRKWEAAYILGLRIDVLKLHGAVSVESYTAACDRMVQLSDRVSVGVGTSAAIYPSLAVGLEAEYHKRYAPEHKEVSAEVRQYAKDSTRKVFKPSSGSSL